MNSERETSTDPVADAALPIDLERLPSSPFSFVREVARGRYRRWLWLLTLGEAINATCGILLPFALGKILSAVIGAHEPVQLRDMVEGPLGRCCGP